MTFVLHPRLVTATVPIGDLPLSRVLLLDVAGYGEPEAGAGGGGDADVETLPGRVGLHGGHEGQVEPVPSEPAIAATIAALRRAQEWGATIVLVRLPTIPEMRALEDAWGAAETIERIRRAAAKAGDPIPLIDFHELPSYPELAPAIRDGSHVSGDAGQRLLSTSLGRHLRAALDAGRAPPQPTVPSR